LSADERETFGRDGLIRFRAAIDDAVDIADRVWAHLGGRGIARDDAATWPQGAVHQLHGIGSSPGQERGYALALDSVLGAGRWKGNKRGGQVAVTFPTPGPWTLPTGTWHTDAPYTEPLEPIRGALLFAFVDRVEAGSGGTLVLAGSHRVAARFAAARATVGTDKMATTRKAFFRSHEWLDALVRDGAEPTTRMERFSAEADIDGLPMRVVELTGEPGDIVVTHPLMVHCTAPNCGERPRIMRIMRPFVTAP
jgi:Phytanoyl-CoA dioxygenase (PhyH)